MKTRTVTVHEGEMTGELDWSYDFAAHGWDKGGSLNPGMIPDKVNNLRKLQSGEWEATTDGGWPRCGWGMVLAVGMYDGWPHWTPTPSVLMTSSLGGAVWHPWYSISDVREITNVPTEVPTDEKSAAGTALSD